MAWLAAYQSLFTWLAIISALTFVISLLALPWLVARIPTDYFCHHKRQLVPLKPSHPVLRLIIVVTKNLFGWVLLVGGFIMLFIPGQGLLTIAMGLLLMDYPGKFNLERKLVAKPAILGGLNWLRTKAGAPALVLDEAG
ncbi:hypothetical protein A9Q89_07585 [Gammaproteobacteria bacterium 53_120_T64]|nr:hypothetical protein A9Q89_07585 [Gammaproteobacteria bacterium 53_120_T64]